MQENVKKIKSAIEEYLQNSEDYNNLFVDYILINENNAIAVATNNDKGLIFSGNIDKITDNKNVLQDWDFNSDEYLFQELEKGYEIGFMSNITHNGIWNEIKNPESITYKNGLQLYLQYCVDNGITKKYINEKTTLDTPDIMQYFKGLALHEIMTYRGYVIESEDTNYDNPKEIIVNIYKCREDFNDNKVNESVSLNSIDLKQNIKNYIDEVYIDKLDLEIEKAYITFILGYDLLHDMIKKYNVLECEKNYDFCDYIANRFLDSEEYSNFNCSSYTMLQEWLSKNMSRIEQEYKEKIVFKNKIYNGNMIMIDKGFRKNIPICFLKRTIYENEKDYIIAFNYKITEDKISWDYAYYYGNLKEKAEKYFKKVMFGGHLVTDENQKKSKLRVKFIGIDNWERPVYKDIKGNLYKDINLGSGALYLHTSVNNDFYGEPDYPIDENIKVYIVEDFKKDKINKKEGINVAR